MLRGQAVSSGRLQQAGIGPKTVFCQPRVKVRQNVRRHVVVQSPDGNDGIKKLYGRIDSSPNSRVDDSFHLEQVDKQLRGDGGVDLADAAESRCYFEAAGRSRIKFQHCFLGDAGKGNLF